MPARHQHHHRHQQHRHQQQKVKLNDKAAEKLHFFSTAVNIPHPDKRDKHGEDACFQTTRSLGVFDGVGQCNEDGIDPGRYSKRLALIVKERIQVENESIPEAVRYALGANKLPGSCTICAAQLNGRKLKGRNVGDSGLIVIRKGKVVYEITERPSRSREFNQPCQVSYEHPNDYFKAEHINFDLEEGDIVVVATDGLWDNVFPKDIVRLVKSHQAKWKKHGLKRLPKQDELKALQKFTGHVVKSKVTAHNLSDKHEAVGVRMQELALEMAERACTASKKSFGDSPFARKALEHNILLEGGKQDDITIVIGMVVSSRDRYRAFIEADCPNC